METKTKGLSISRYLDKYSLLEESQKKYYKIKFWLTGTSGVLEKGRQMCGFGAFSRCIS